MRQDLNVTQEMARHPVASVVVVDSIDSEAAQRSLSSARQALRGLPAEFSVTHDLEADIEVARGDYIVILDAHALVVGGLVDLLRFLEYHRTIGLVAPKLVNRAGESIATSRGFSPMFDKITGRLPARRMRRSRDWDDAFPSLVEYVTGPCKVIRRQALVQAGKYEWDSLPEADMDFCRRMGERGWGVVYFPLAVVIHRESRRRSPGAEVARRGLAALAHYLTKDHLWRFGRARG